MLHKLFSMSSGLNKWVSILNYWKFPLLLAVWIWGPIQAGIFGSQTSICISRDSESGVYMNRLYMYTMYMRIQGYICSSFNYWICRSGKQKGDSWVIICYNVYCWKKSLKDISQSGLPSNDSKEKKKKGENPRSDVQDKKKISTRNRRLCANGYLFF
jgi:hypothetical protein